MLMQPQFITYQNPFKTWYVLIKFDSSVCIMLLTMQMLNSSKWWFVLKKDRLRKLRKFLTFWKHLKTSSLRDGNEMTMFLWVVRVEWAEWRVCHLIALPSIAITLFWLHTAFNMFSISDFKMSTLKFLYQNHKWFFGRFPNCLLRHEYIQSISYNWWLAKPLPRNSNYLIIWQITD